MFWFKDRIRYPCYDSISLRISNHWPEWLVPDSSDNSHPTFKSHMSCHSHDWWINTTYSLPEMLKTCRLLTEILPKFPKFQTIHLSSHHDEVDSATTFNFAPSQETRTIIQLARKFTKDHIIPVANRLDQSGEVSYHLLSKKWLRMLNCSAISLNELVSIGNYGKSSHPWLNEFLYSTWIWRIKFVLCWFPSHTWRVSLWMHRS